MTFKKSRLASAFALAMVVCMIFGMMVVPASAAETGVEFVEYYCTERAEAASILVHYGALTGTGYDPVQIATSLGYTNDVNHSVYKNAGGTIVVLKNTVEAVLSAYDTRYNTNHSEKLNGVATYSDGKRTYVFVDIPEHYIETDGEAKHKFMIYSPAESNLIAGSVTPASLSGILDQITELLPVVVVFLVGAIAITKGISFITGVLHGA